MKNQHFCLCLVLAVLSPSVALAAPPDRIANGDLVVGVGEQVGDAVSLGGGVTVAGWASGDVVAMGGSVRVLPGGRVDGDVTALGGAVLVEPGGVVAGDRVALGGVRRDIPAVGSAPGLVAGPVLPRLHRPAAGSASVVGRALHMAGLYALLVLLGVVMLGLAPQRTRALAAAVAAYPARSLGFGFLVVLATVAAIVVLCVTVVGVPVAVALAALGGAAAVLGLTGISILIGELLPSKRLRDRQTAKLAVGAAILVGALSIPVAGPVIGVLATVLGLGALAVTRLRPGHAVFVTGAGPYRSAPAP